MKKLETYKTLEIWKFSFFSEAPPPATTVRAQTLTP